MEHLMLSRGQVVQEYLTISDNLHVPTNLGPLLQELPPFLCRTIAFQNPIPPSLCSKMAAFTGTQFSEIEWWPYQEAQVGLLTYSDQFSTLNVLPLEGHQLTLELQARKNFFFRALEHMAIDEPQRLQSVMTWTSLVIWMEREVGSKTSLLTSSTFPKLPHCTFLSDKCLHHIPPNSIASWDSDYAIRENLYHESLHQELAALLLHRDILRENYSAKTAPKVPIPWRGASWEPDRVFHAIHVYNGLLPMRIQEIDSHESGSRPFVWTIQALAEGANALRYLVRKLDEQVDIFTNQGRAVYDAIRTRSLDTLNTVRSTGLTSKVQIT